MQRTTKQVDFSVAKHGWTVGSGRREEVESCPFKPPPSGYPASDELRNAEIASLLASSASSFIGAVFPGAVEVLGHLQAPSFPDSAPSALQDLTPQV